MPPPPFKLISTHAQTGLGFLLALLVLLGGNWLLFEHVRRGVLSFELRQHGVELLLELCEICFHGGSVLLSPGCKTSAGLCRGWMPYFYGGGV